MPPQRIIANSFISGEISPELYGRHDLKAYFNGAAALENFIVRRTGGIRKRPGTQLLTMIDYPLEEDGSPAIEAADVIENKYRVIPYFYDKDIFGLLVLRLVDIETLQAKLIVFNQGIESAGEWMDANIYTGINTVEKLERLKYRQVGDTLFFTLVGTTTFKCVVTIRDMSAQFTALSNSIYVPVPGRMTFTADGFAAAKDETYYTRTKKYALFGVKDGVISKARTGQINITIPWRGGAIIKVTGTTDFHLHDYYILAKMSGINYGKIAELYPEESTVKISGTATGGWLAPWIFSVPYDPVQHQVVFNPDRDLLLSGSPDTLASSVPQVNATAVSLCISTESRTADDGVTTIYRAVTPHYKVNGTGRLPFSAAFVLRTTAVRYAALTVAEVSLIGTVVDITPFYYRAGMQEVAYMDKRTVTIGTYGQITVPLPDSLYGQEYYLGYIIESTNAKLKDCIFMGSHWIGDNQNAATTAEKGYVPIEDAVAAVPPEANLLTEPEELDPLVCRWTVVGRVNDIVYTTIWQNYTPVDTICVDNAGRVAAQQLTRIPCLLDQSLDYHPTGAFVGSYEFTLPAGEKIYSIDLYIGAKSICDTHRDSYRWAARSTTVTLTTVKDSEVITLGEYDIPQSTIHTRNIRVTYPDGFTPDTTYKLTFSDNIPLRGLTLQKTQETFEFIDDNIIPGEVTGIQEMLVVGDLDMDTDLMDVFEQRLVFASSMDLPFTLWFSAVGNIYSFYAGRPQADNDAFSVTIPATRASRILHIVAGSEILLFTEDGVYGADAEGGLSYRTIRIRKLCNAVAAANVRPIQIDGKTIFVGADGRTVYELKYSLMDDSTLPTDRSILAYHITEQAQIVAMAYQQFPDSVIWFLLDDGTMASLTYMPEHEVFAWARHTIDFGEENRRIVDILAPGSLVTGDGMETTSHVLLVVEKYDEDGSRLLDTTVEAMRPNICENEPRLEAALCRDHIGTEYATDIQARLVTLRPENPDFSSQGLKKNVLDVCLRIRRSGGMALRPMEASIGRLDFTPNAPAARRKGEVDRIPLVTGDIKKMPKGYISGDGQMEIVSTDVYPCEILSIVFTVDVNG